jgi:hypothetical protein
MAGVSPRRDGHSSGTPVAGRLEQPTRATRPTDKARGRTRASLLFGLAPGGACRAADVAACAVRSYRTLSPLPRRTFRPRLGGLLSVALSLGSPPPDVIRRRVRMEPGLSSALRKAAAVRPTGSKGHMSAGRRRSRGKGTGERPPPSPRCAYPPRKSGGGYCTHPPHSYPANQAGGPAKASGGGSATTFLACARTA